MRLTYTSIRFRFNYEMHNLRYSDSVMILNWFGYLSQFVITYNLEESVAGRISHLRSVVVCLQYCWVYCYLLLLLRLNSRNSNTVHIYNEIYSTSALHTKTRPLFSTFKHVCLNVWIIFRLFENQKQNAYCSVTSTDYNFFLDRLPFFATAFFEFFINAWLWIRFTLHTCTFLMRIELNVEM